MSRIVTMMYARRVCATGFIFCFSVAGTVIKCQHWTLALIPRPSCYVGYYSQTKTKAKREMCVMPKTAGFKNFAF
eukprot:scaffold1496_cov37-Cyclotella_meneghiniana.AAC.2